MTIDLFWLAVGFWVVGSWVLLTREFKRWPKNLRTYDRRKFIAFGGFGALAVTWWYHEGHWDGWTTTHSWALVALSVAFWFAEDAGWFED